MLPTVFIISIVSLLFGAYMAYDVLRREDGTPEMRKVSNAIHSGAEAFLKRQNRTIGLFAIGAAFLLYLLYAFVKGDAAAAWEVTLSFLLGAVLSVASGYIGMATAIRTNIRAASAARNSLSEALQTALRGGAVSGIAVVALSLLGVAGLFVLLGGTGDDEAVLKSIPLRIIGFGFGASFVALFAQLGGGIYTKAADVGADLVGKVEAGIPEDDPRNPAVIADLVGDNVGDCAGRGADLFESTAAENIGAMILGASLYPVYGKGAILFPLVARAFGLIASMIGILAARGEDENPMSTLNRGYLVTTVLAAGGFYAAVHWLLDGNLWLFAAGLIGIVTSFLFVWITQYYTETQYRPVKSIAEACLTGPATTIITGLAVAFECTAMPILVISAALLGSYFCGVNGLIGKEVQNAGLYGTAIATMGMLSTCAYILAMDTFGPITDNAGGIVEMSGQPTDVRKRTDRLDGAGNTTKALTKGYAIGSAALAAFLLFSAYLDEVSHVTGTHFNSVDIAKLEVFVGGMLGATLVYLFSSLAIRAVGNAAGSIIVEVRRQFKEKPGILQGTEDPDYAACVDMVTADALKQMVVPGLLAVGTPIAVGMGFKLVYGSGAEAVASFLMIGTISGILMALVMNNGGGAWDNAKKLIETGAHGGKGSPAHKAAVVGDTVGDPLKDTAGPSLHVLIKLLATVTMVLAPLFI